jgi:hypothetical protein
MSVNLGATPTEVNLGNAPSPPAGGRLGVWQAGVAYPDPNYPEHFVRDSSVWLPNLGGVDPRTTTTETIGEASQGKLVTLTNAGAIAVTLDSTAASDFMCFVAVLGGGVATLTPSSGTIDGAANLAVATLQGVVLFFDGTNWFTERGMGLGSTGATTTVNLTGLAAGNNTIAHGLGYSPTTVIIQMNSGGAIWFQTPTRWDATNFYIVASDAGVVGVAEVWR